MTYTEVGWASDGTHPLSQANMKTLDAGLVDIHGRWTLASGTFSGTGSLFLTLPTGHGFERLTLQMAGVLDTSDFIRLRVNEIGSDHLFGYISRRASDGAVVDTFHATTSSAIIADWGAQPVQILSCLIMRQADGRKAWFTSGHRPSSTATSTRISEAHGTLLTDTAEVTNLRLLTNTSGTSMTVRYRVSGLP